MKIKDVFALKSLSAAMVAGILILASCAKNNDVLNSSDTQNVNSESVSDSYTSETADMSNSIVGNVSSTQYGSARVDGRLPDFGGIDPRLAGAAITIVGTGGKDNPSGTITIDFGAAPGITTNGVARIGQIIVTYSGKKGAIGSTRAISYNGYSRNGVAFDNAMTFTITNVKDSTQFHHVLAGGKLTFPDKTTITRDADFNVALDYVAKTLSLSATTAAHSASGTTRAGKEYTMDINTALVYKASCLATKVYIPASGKKTITAGLTYIIDYGDGTCDNTVTITVGGKSAIITVNGDGN